MVLKFRVGVAIASISAFGFMLGTQAANASSNDPRNTHVDSRAIAASTEPPIPLSSLILGGSVWRDSSEWGEPAVFPKVNWKVANVQTNASICDALREAKTAAYQDFQAVAGFEDNCFTYSWEKGNPRFDDGTKAWEYVPAPAVTFYGELPKRSDTPVWLQFEDSDVCNETPGTDCVIQDPRGAQRKRARDIPFFRGFERAQQTAYNQAAAMCSASDVPVVIVVPAHEIDNEDVPGAPDQLDWLSYQEGEGIYVCSDPPRMNFSYGSWDKNDRFYSIKPGKTQFPVAWSRGGANPSIFCSYDRWVTQSYNCRYQSGRRATAGAGILEFNVNPTSVKNVKFRR